MGCPAPGDGINQFALVTYVPEPLGSFLDRLREELVPECNPRAHVTVLPPRPLPEERVVDWRPTWEQLDADLQGALRFTIAADRIEVFEETSVVFLGLSQGSQELHRLHDRLNHGDVSQEERFGYHPHLTVAQGIPPERVAALRDLAERRWAEYTGPRSFVAESLVFVQNTTTGRWLDLATAELQRANAADLP